MTRLRRFLKNLAKRGLLLNIFFAFCLISGCTSSTAPTYLREDIDEAIQDICKKEYKTDVRVKLSGQTLWVYLPLEDILAPAQPEKAEKYTERFLISDNQAALKEGELKLEYAITDIPEREETQAYQYDKDVVEKINNVWKVLRRVIFSMERSKKNEPNFFCLVTADIKNGFQIQTLSYALDLKKVSYEFISWSEYQHRCVDETAVSPEIIEDREGLHLDYRDITLGEFIARQIEHRIKLKFQKPEVAKGADIDKEILKIVGYTVKIYDFKDFTAAQLYNLLTQKKTILNRAAVEAAGLYD